MNALPNSNRKTLFLASFFLAIFLMATYLPLVLNGGIIVDDWGDISQNFGCNGFFDCYRSWFPLFSNRPLAPLPITATTLLFTTNFTYYLVFNTFIYFLAIGITFNLIWRIGGGYAAFVFAFLASIPMIAMPLIASPINQSTATVAYLYWALSLQCLYTYCQNRSKTAFWLSSFFLLCGFLTYEVILPLLGLSILLPFIIHQNNSKQSTRKYFYQFVLPVIVILLLVVVWQKGIAPKIYEIDYSRLATSPSLIIVTFKSWIHVFTSQIPELFINSQAFFTQYDLLTSGLLTLGVFCAFGIRPSPISNIEKHWKFFLASLLCFLSSSLIFILSGVAAESGGYQSRGLSSTWFSLAIFASSLIAITNKNGLKNVLLILIVTFGSLSSLSFSIQRDQYIQSWKLQNEILEDVIALVEINSVPKNATILGNVPQFLPRDYNNEIVFSQPWDFGSALAIITKQKISGGAVLDSRSGNFHNLQFANDELILDRWWKAPQGNLWFYNYDSVTKNSSLVKVESTTQLKGIISSLGYKADLDAEARK